MKLKTAYILLIIASSLSAQQGLSPFGGFELAKLSYELTPSLGEVQLEEKTASVGIILPLKKSMLSVNVAYSKYDLWFNEQPALQSVENFEDIHSVQLSLFYRRPLENNWSVNGLFSPVLASTFNGKLSSNDFVFSSFLSATKMWIKDNLRSSFTFGAGFGTVFGRPSAFPVISYNKQINQRLRYSLGIPVTGLFYTIDDNNSINVTARPEGFFVNNSSPFYDSQLQQLDNTKLQYNALKLSLGYNLKFDKNWVTSFNIGYLPISNMEVVDEDGDSIFDLESDSSVFLNASLSFNIDKRNKNKNK